MAAEAASKVLMLLMMAQAESRSQSMRIWSNAR